jgi:tetratricopeptide (TPR) repeat protein
MTVVLGIAAIWQAGLVSGRTTPEPAMQQYRVATHLLRQVTPEQVRKSVHLLELSVVQYPDVALTQAGLANALIAEVELGSDNPHTKLVRARMAAARAKDLSPRLEQARIVAGLTLLLADWDWDGAETELRRATMLNPASAPAHQTLAYVLLKAGRFTEAAQAIGRAAELDPVSPIIGAQQAHIFYSDGHFQAAVRVAEAVLDRQPGFALARYYLALSLAHLGLYERALRELGQTDLHRNLIEVDRAWILARAGDVQSARKLAGSLPPTQGIVLRVELAEFGAALQGLEQLIEERSPDALNLIAEPRLRPLHSLPAYDQLLRRVGL